MQVTQGQGGFEYLKVSTPRLGRRALQTCWAALSSARAAANCSWAATCACCRPCRSSSTSLRAAAVSLRIPDDCEAVPGCGRSSGMKYSLCRHAREGAWTASSSAEVAVAAHKDPKPALCSSQGELTCGGERSCAEMAAGAC